MTDTPTEVETVTFSNVSVVRDKDGKLELYVGKEKCLGAGGITYNPGAGDNGAWIFVVPGNRVRLCELTPPAQVVLEKRDNILTFPNMRAALVTTTDSPRSA